MPSPGSSHALVLPSSSHAAGDPDPVVQAEKDLERFLENSRYEAIAVVHRLNKTASLAYGLAKGRLIAKRGVVWVTDPALVARLSGPHAAELKKMLKEYPLIYLTFWNVANAACRRKLMRSELNGGDVLSAFVAAQS